MAQLTFDGRPVSSDEYKRLWTERLRTDPEMQRIFQDITSPDYAQRSGQQRAAARAEVERLRAAGEPVDAALSYQAYGGGDFQGEQHREIAARERAMQLGFQPQDDWTLDFDQGGFRVERENFVNRNKEWLIPAAIGGVGVAGGLGAFGGAAGAAGGGSAASSAVPAAGTSLGPGVGFGAGGAPVASAGFASGGGALTGAGTAAGIIGPVVSSKDFWGKTLFGLGGDLLNGYLNNRSANNAADELIKAGDKQVALYDKALGPYMDPGPLNALKFLSGMPAGGGPVQGSTTGTPVPGTERPTATATGGRLAPVGAESLGTAVPRPGRLSSLTGATPQSQAAQQQASSYVSMIGPDGTPGNVHPSQVQNAILAGAKLPQAMGRG